MKQSFVLSLFSRAFFTLFLAIGCSMHGYTADEQEAQEAAEIDIGYYALTPSFVSNLSGGPKYIRCDIQLMTKAAIDIPKIELHAPALRHAILMLIAGQDGARLKQREGKEALRLAALAAVQQQLEAFTGKAIVSDLFFSAYYVK